MTGAHSKKMPVGVLCFLMVLMFFFRLAFGLFSNPILTPDDARQTYLIGLKAYTTHTWPYYGPDTEDPSEGNFKAQSPGALEGCLIAGALFVWPNPLAPYVLVNLLTLLAFVFMGWYIGQRLPNLPSWMIYLWLLVCPWDVQISTQVFNLSFGAAGSCLFLVGFLESIPLFRVGKISVAWANALMGFSVLWIMQFHLSWVLFAALAFVSLVLQWIREQDFRPWLSFLTGTVLPALFILPTYLRYGLSNGGNPSGLLVLFNWGHVTTYFVTLIRFLSFSTFELPRFLGGHTPQRIEFFKSAPWLLVPGLFLLAAGWLHTLGLLVLFFLKGVRREIKWVTLGVSLLIWASFLFTVRYPDAHRFYLTFPFAALYSFYAWDYLIQRPFWKKTLSVLVLTALVFQAGYMVKTGLDGKSNYLMDRDATAKAIAAQDYHLLGERPSYSSY